MRPASSHALRRASGPRVGYRSQLMRVPTEAVRYLTWLVAGLGASCTFSAPPPDNTTYRCSQSSQCPDGFACVSGFCMSADLLPDASTLPDGPIDNTPTTISFGARPSATLRNNITTDTYLTSDAATTTHGTEEQLTIDGSPAAVALLRFELASVTATSTVISAQLTVNVFDVLTEGVVTARALELPWDETSATWNQAAAGTIWATPGAGGVAIGATALDASGEFNATGDVVVELAPAVVQTWISEPTRNRGLRIEATGNQNLRVRSSEVADATQAPMLTVTFRRGQ
jgi:hypothetical protein